ncbi:hypothetical protein J5I95_13650 [Candidatus Poribacteria bacterium]|nr:hypothetical protein [Candidatus Poribacteria bacterium]
MNSSFVSQGDSDGRHYTIWTGSIQSLRKKIPHFTQEVFKIEKGINKYMDCIVREPLPDLREDMGIHEIREEVGYPEAATGDRIPIAAVRNSYGLVSHQKMLDDVLGELEVLRPDVRNTDLQDLQATMKLSIYGARIYIEFLLPDYRKEPYTLKVTCRNSVDTKDALTINLFLHRADSADLFKPDIPFHGFHHVHTNELRDDAIRNFMFNAVHRFLYTTWKTDEVNYDDLLIIIDKTRNISPKQGATIIGRLGPKKKTVNIYRFLEILSELTLTGSDIFRNQERKLTMLAILTGELRKLTQEGETQQY